MKRRKNTPDSFYSRHRQFMALTADQYTRNTEGSEFQYLNPNVKIISVYQPDFAGNNGASGNEDDLVKILETKNLIHEKYCKLWGDWYNWYAGENIGDYIHRHHRERTEIWKKRKERAYYYNYTGAIVDLIAAFIYSKTIVRSFFKQNEELAQQEHVEKNEFWTDCDLKGTSIDEFMQKANVFSQIFGFIDILEDMPKSPEEIVNEQQRLDANIRPYLYHVIPMNVVNWEVDDKGEFLWYRWRKKVDKQENPFSLKLQEIIHRYYTWTRNAWYIHEVKQLPRDRKKIAYLVDSGIHNLGIVPVVRFYGKRDMLDENIGKSFVEPIGKINVGIANYVSLLEEEISSKVFNILALEDPNAMSDSETSDTAANGVEIGNNNALLWSGQHPPFYLAPATDPGRFIIEWIDKSTEEIYKLATLWTDTGIRESRSGVSYSYEFNRTNAMLADKAQLMEEGEIRVHKIYCRWLEEDWVGTVDYPDSYDVEVLEQELLIVTQAKNAVRSPTFKRELEKRIARKVLSHSTTDVIETIMDEIDTLEEPILIDATKNTPPQGSFDPVAGV